MLYHINHWFSSLLEIMNLKLYTFKVGDEVGKDFGWIGNPNCDEECPSNCRGNSWMHWNGVTGGRGSWKSDNSLQISGRYILFGAYKCGNLIKYYYLLKTYNFLKSYFKISLRRNNSNYQTNAEQRIL
jgi:hypothetical protein